MRVYHGSSNKNLKFNPKKPLMFFTTSKEDARGWAERLILGGKKNTGSYIYTAELNFKNLYERGDDFNPEYAEYENHEAKDEIWDEIFFEDIDEKREELVKAGFDCFHIELGDGLEYYIVPYECRNIIKWIDKEILSEDLNEHLEKMGDCFITKSPYDIVNLFKNKPKEYRVLYDKNIDMYMIGDAESVTHYDMVQKAYKDAYYYNMEDFIQDLGGTIDNYTEMGQSGYWDGEDDENFDAYLWYIVFSPNEEWELGTDGYDKRYDYPFGHVFTRGCDLSEIGLWDALGVPQNSEKLNESADNLNDAFWKWFGKSKIVNPDGTPKIVYHSTNSKFKKFNLKKLGFASEYPTADFGFYFSDSGLGYGKIKMPCYIKMENPYYIEVEEVCDFDYNYKNIDKNEFNGYDGLIIHSKKDSYYKRTDVYDYCVFSPNQIKSIDNKGTWSTTSDNIYESLNKELERYL